ncbi:hypothetical protein Ahy_A05g025217 isoform A [Arachis hypogaea]|uniref:Uncharacterized protein n=1 Tax=Arachis hypogaea TaxID=3818 RepID=A0A445D8F1_ARAHY|nr:hypothetical protein Ahy_A05g025217 isoform A [Arachis hypogaea]
MTSTKHQTGTRDFLFISRCGTHDHQNLKSSEHRSQYCCALGSLMVISQLLFHAVVVLIEFVLKSSFGRKYHSPFTPKSTTTTTTRTEAQPEPPPPPPVSSWSSSSSELFTKSTQINQKLKVNKNSPPPPPLSSWSLSSSTLEKSKSSNMNNQQIQQQ